MMRQLFVLGAVVAMVMGLAVTAGAYAVSVTVSAGPIATTTRCSQVDFGDYVSGAVYDVPWLMPPGSYLAACATSLYTGNQVSGTFGNPSTTPMDFYVWTSDLITAPIDLYIFLTDDGNPSNPDNWGGSYVSWSGWKVTDVTTNTVLGTFDFKGLATTTYDATDPNAILVGTINAGTNYEGAEHLQIVREAPCVAITSPTTDSTYVTHSSTDCVVRHGVGSFRRCASHLVQFHGRQRDLHGNDLLVSAGNPAATRRQHHHNNGNQQHRLFQLHLLIGLLRRSSTTGDICRLQLAEQWSRQ